MATGSRPLTRSWMRRRWANDVLPDDDGPAMRIRRRSPRRAAMWSAISAVGDVVAVEDVGPALRLGEDVAELRLGLGGRHLAARLHGRRAQQEPGREKVEREAAERPRVAEHGAVKVVGVIAATINADRFLRECRDQVRLLDGLRLLEDADGLVARQKGFDDRPVFGDDGAHFRLDFLDALSRQIARDAAHLDEQAAIRGEIDRDLGGRVEFVDGRDEEEDDAPPVDVPPLGRLEPHECQIVAAVHGVLQVVNLVVEVRGDRGGRKLRRTRFQELRPRRPRRRGGVHENKKNHAFIVAWFVWFCEVSGVFKRFT